MNKNNVPKMFPSLVSSLRRTASVVVACLVMSTPLIADPFDYESLPGNTISDNACVDSSISVSDNFVVSDLDVGVNLSHTYRADLTIKLSAPDGTTAILYDKQGGSGDNLDISLDDEHSNLVANVGSVAHDVAAPFFEHAYRPDNLLGVFDGMSSAGSWILQVCDDAGNDTGTVHRVSLTFNGSATGGGVAGTGPRDFQERQTVEFKGNFEYVGNTLLQCVSGCVTDNHNQSPMTYVDIDGDGSTFNSSSALVSLPADAEVTWAGLYWGGVADVNTSTWSGVNNTADAAQKNSLRLKAPGGSYQTVVADVIDTISDDPATGWNAYQAFTDVTDIVKSSGAGDYTVANVQLDYGGGDSSTAFTGPNGGWNLVVFYRADSEQYRRITLWDGYDFVYFSDANHSFVIDSILTPPVPGFETEVAFTCYDGEVTDGNGGGDGDFVAFSNEANKLSNATNPSTNVCNGTITKNGSNVANRNPAPAQNWGFDVDRFSSNSLSANADSVTAIFGSSNEGIWFGNFILSSEIFAPPLVEKSFESNVAVVDVPQEMTISLHNTNVTGNLDNISFSDVYPAGLSNVGSNVVKENTCGGSLIANANSTSLSFSGGTLSADSSCSITVHVYAQSSAAGDSLENCTGLISTTSTDSQGESACASILVTDGGTPPVSTTVGEYRFDDCGGAEWLNDYSINTNTATGTKRAVSNDAKSYACTSLSAYSSAVEVPHIPAYAMTEGAVSMLVYDHHNVWAADRGHLLEKTDTNGSDYLNMEMKNVNGDIYQGTFSIDLNGNIIDTGETFFNVTSANDGDFDTDWVHVMFTFGPQGMRLYVDGQLKGTNAYTGGFNNLDSAFKLPHFSGFYDEFYILDGQPSDAQVQTLHTNLLANKNIDGSNRTCDCSSPFATISGKVYIDENGNDQHDLLTGNAGSLQSDLLLLYRFGTGSGNTVYDISGVGSPMDLTITDPSRVTWMSGGGLSIDSSTSLEAVTDTKVTTALKASNEVTVEAWIKPDNLTQDGPARIVTLSKDTSKRNLTLGQEDDDYNARLRTSTNSNNGSSPSTTATGVVETVLQHVVYTRTAAGAAKIYVDGALVGNRTVNGSLNNLDSSYRFALANELTGSRAWLGDFHKVAVYQRALNASEIGDLFAEGAVSGEPLLSDIAVSLYDDGGTSSISDDVLLGSVSTSAGGAYEFHNVLLGSTYRVEVNTADTDLPTGANIGTTNPLTGVSVTSGTTTSNQNFGFDIEGVQPPFTCSANIYIAKSTNENQASQFSSVDTSTSPFTLNTIGGTAHGHNYNALGYRNQDDYLYGIKLKTNNLLKIGADGSVQDLGAVAGLPSPSGLLESYDSGDVFPDGYLYIHEVGTHDEIYKIDVTTTPPSLVQTINLSQSIWLSDFAYNALDGKVYGMGDQGEKFMIDPTTSPNWTVITVGSNAPAASYGAAYTDNLGNVYIYKNNPGTFYLVDFGLNGTGTGTMTELSTAPNVAFNDGASCRGAPPVEIAAISGTVYADSNSNDSYDSGTESGVGAITVSLFNDADGAVIDTTSTAANGAYSFSYLDATLTYRIAVDTADADLAGKIIGTTNPLTEVAVTAGNTTADQDFGFDDGGTPAVYTTVGEYRFDDCAGAEWLNDYSINANTATGTKRVVSDDAKNYACTSLSAYSSAVEVPHIPDYAMTEGAVSMLVYDHHNVWNADRGHLLEKTDTNGSDLLNMEMKNVNGDIHQGTFSVNLNGNIIDTGETFFNVTAASDGDFDTDWVHVMFTFGPQGMRLYVDGQLKGTNAYTGGFNNLDSAFKLPHFSGFYDEFYILDGQPSNAQVQALHANLIANKNIDGSDRICDCSSPFAAISGKVYLDENGNNQHDLLTGNNAGSLQSDLLSLYRFGTGSGNTVYDISGVGSPMDLTITDPSRVTWLPGGGLSIDSSTLLKAAPNNTKLNSALQAGNEVTVEAWIKPDNLTQDGPARIVTISENTTNRNLTLGQEDDDYNARLRTSTNSNNGNSPSTTATGVVETVLQHVVYTRNVAGAARIYVDGALVGSETIGGNLSNLNNSYLFALANELTGNRAWLGDFYKVALYQRALSAAEVSGLFAEGVVSGEPLLSDVTVSLYNDNGTSSTTADDIFLESASTTISGSYEFDGVSTGLSYRVEVDTADTDLPTGANIGTTNPLTGVSVASGTTTSDQNFGFDTTGGQPPFTCSADIYIAKSTNDSQSSQFSSVDTSTSPFTLSAIGDTAHGHNYNALGYRDQDNYLYGIKLKTNNLLRIGADGSVNDLGAVTGLPAPSGLSESYDSGDVFPDGYLYIHEVSTHPEIYKIDVTTTPPSLVQTITLSQSIWLSDFAYNTLDNKVYGIGDQGAKFMIDPSTSPNWTVTTVGSNAPAASYGAAYTDNLGNVYIYKNNPGTFYLVDFGLNGTGTGAMTELSTAPNVAFNDGASCRGAPPVVAEFTAISGTVYTDINNDDSYDSGTESGIGSITVSLLNDVSGAVITTTSTSVNGDYSFSGLDSELAYRLEVDVLDADLAGQTIGTINPLTNVTGTAGSTTTDQNFGFDPLRSGGVPVCWAVDDNTANIYRFLPDTNNPQPPVLIPTTRANSGEGLSWRASTNELYMWNGSTTYVVNAETGADVRTFTAALSPGNHVEGSAFYIDPVTQQEELWLVVEDADATLRADRYLVRIDPNTGAGITSVGPLSGDIMDSSADYGNDIGGLAIDPNTRQFWITDDGLNRGVYPLNEVTGVVGSGILFNPYAVDGEALEFADDGLFYTESDQGPSNDRYIWQANGATGTIIRAAGPIPGDGDVEAVACNAGASVVVPTTCSLIVTTTDDIDSTNNNSGSLRDAIECGNETAGEDTVSFNIPTTESGYTNPDNVPGNADDYWSIQPTSRLPFITDPLVIAGDTQPGYAGKPIIELDGSVAGSVEGLFLDTDSDGSTIRALIVNRFDLSGIELRDSSNHTIVGSYIGTDSSGLVSLGNDDHGIEIADGSGNNTIGGINALDGNIISGNQDSGIRIDGPGSNTVQGNLIGLGRDGQTTMGNVNHGLYIRTSGNQIGGSSDAARNVIADSGYNGIDLSQGTANVIEGNYIGTDSTGTLDRGNNIYGIKLTSADGNTIGSVGAGNLISGNEHDGIMIQSSDSNTVRSNYIGTDVTGTLDLGNTGVGLTLRDSESNQIGGLASDVGNVISANGDRGVWVRDDTSQQNQIQGNVIGTNVTADAALGNGSHGVDILSAVDNEVSQNTIAYNDESGVMLSYAAESNSLLGNNIRDNQEYGVLLQSEAVSNQIVENIISDNNYAGIANDADSNNTFSQNSLSSNGGLGIDLGLDGVTANSDTDVWLNYPDIGNQSSVSTNGTMIVAYDFDLEVPANTHGYRVEFFSNTVVDPSGHGEGEIYLGHLDITHDGAGSKNFKGSFNANQTVAENANIALTLTEKLGATTLGSTSEFSRIRNGGLSVCTDLLADPDAEMVDIVLNENSSEIVYLEALDADGNPVTYAISGGADSSRFVIDPVAPGALFECVTIRFINNPIIDNRAQSVVKVSGPSQQPPPGNYESPVDSGNDNVYDLEITVTDSEGNTVTKPLSVIIKDVNEKPVITSAALVDFLERQGTSTVVMDLQSYDPDADDAEGSGLTYSISGGADGLRFDVDTQSGELRFVDSPDYGAPADSNGDNQYELNVRVTDDQGYSGSKAVKVTVTDDPDQSGVRVALKALLQGPYDWSASLMSDSLSSLELLPLNQPYASEPFNYQGAETLSSASIDLTGDEAIVDWVLVELRSSTDRTQVVATMAALLRRNGDVVDAGLNGSGLTFDNVASGEYYISLRHRNHLGVMTATPLSLSMSPVLVDFSRVDTPVYGEHARLSDGDIATLWSGDVNQDNRLILNGQGSDINPILTAVLIAPGNSGFNSSYQVPGYNATDLNMDGKTVFMGPSNDANILLGNTLVHPGNANFSGNYIAVGGLR